MSEFLRKDHKSPNSHHYGIFFRMKSEGRITDVVVYGIQKRYSPEKHYVFILKITRENVKAPTYVFRTYKEFCELDSKLHTQFSATGCHR